MTTTVSRNPTGDEAVSGTWTGTAGSRYLVVDDYPDTAGTDVLTHGTTTAGNLTFTFTAFSLPTEATNISVAVLYYDDKNGAQACNIAARLKVGGAYYAATSHNPTNATFVQRTDTFATNPRTSAAWTPAQVNGTDGTNPLQAFGWVSTDASPSIDLTSIRLNVTYDRDLVLVGAVGSFSLTGNAAGLSVTRKLTADVGSFSLVGNDATLTKGGGLNNYNLPASTGSFSLTGVAATPKVGRKLVASLGTYSLVGVAATPKVGRRITGDTGTFSFVGNNATISKSGFNNITIAAAAGSFLVTGINAGVRKTKRLVAAVGSFSLSGVAANFKYNRVIGASPRAFNITGRSANLVYSGAQVANKPFYYQVQETDPRKLIVNASASNGQLVYYVNNYLRVL